MLFVCCLHRGWPSYLASVITRSVVNKVLSITLENAAQQYTGSGLETEEHSAGMFSLSDV
jgi:hypothetical protein